MRSEAPSRWVGPAVAIALPAFLVGSTLYVWLRTDREMWAQQWPLLGSMPFALGAAIWLGVGLFRRRPKAYRDAALLLGLLTLAMLAGLIGALVVSPGDGFVVGSLGGSVLASGLGAGLLWRDWRRIRS